MTFRYKRISGVATIIQVVVMSVLSASCKQDGKSFDDAIADRANTPVMTTRGVESYISENGIIKYCIKAQEWLVYDKSDPPYQAFEKGAYLETYDSLMNVDSKVMADTAYYYEDTETWELRGNVHAESSQGELFDTPQLFWNQRREKVYSDSTIRIQQDNQIIVGRGFESNQDFTNYTIRKTEGVFPVKE